MSPLGPLRPEFYQEQNLIVVGGGMFSRTLSIYFETDALEKGSTIDKRKERKYNLGFEY